MIGTEVCSRCVNAPSGVCPPLLAAGAGVAAFCANEPDVTLFEDVFELAVDDALADVLEDPPEAALEAEAPVAAV